MPHPYAELGARIYEMARYCKGKPFADWPGFSTGENLMVALVLNDHQALAACHHTMAEAFYRVELSADQLRTIERAVNNRNP